MRNSFLPTPPSQSIFNLANELGMPSLDVSSALDSISNINDHSDGLWSLPQFFNDEEMKGENSGKNYFQPNVFMSSPHTYLHNYNKNTDQCHQKSNSKRKRVLLCSAQQSHHRAKRNSGKEELCASNVSLRKSQKIGDKITILQKLVSPYGKTDTASVLQEASLYIKLLQEQIQHIIQMLSTSYHGIRAFQIQEYKKQQNLINLQSRGLCLVPVSTVERVTEETTVDDHSTYPPHH